MISAAGIERRVWAHRGIARYSTKFKLTNYRTVMLLRSTVTTV